MKRQELPSKLLRKSAQAILEIFPYFKNKTQRTPEILLNSSKSETPRTPEILSNFSENETQENYEIISKSLKNRKTPKVSEILSYFKSEIKHKELSKFFQIL